MSYKSGFVTIIGRPNVGKSTLTNQLLGEKISIISTRPQTTRKRIRAIYTEERGQIIFVDTPGIHKARNKLDKYMLDEAFSTLKDVDVVIFMVEADSSFGKGDKFILNNIQGLNIPVVVVMNKIDCINGKKLPARQRNYENKIGKEVIPVSAVSGKNTNNLIDRIFSLLPEGPQYYPEDMITDQIERFIVAEIVREKIFHVTREEIPYGAAVLVEEMKERENGLIYIRANVYVEKKSHKGIVIGKNGKMLKNIGRRARNDIEEFLQTRVYLDLWVKVKKNWREKERLLAFMGYKE